MLAATVDFVGAQHLVYASDLPHWDGEFPENLEEIRAADDLSVAVKRQILHDNAQQLFSL